MAGVHDSAAGNAAAVAEEETLPKKRHKLKRFV
jgi:hypothetical protein